MNATKWQYSFSGFRSLLQYIWKTFIGAVRTKRKRPVRPRENMRSAHFMSQEAAFSCSRPLSSHMMVDGLWTPHRDFYLQFSFSDYWDQTPKTNRETQMRDVILLLLTSWYDREFSFLSIPLHVSQWQQLFKENKSENYFQ